MNHLRAELMRKVPSNEGPQADVLIIEPDGTEHQVRCLCRGGETVLGELGDGQRIPLLEEKYGAQVLVALTRHVTLNE
ncbi:MAG: hypothetical protein M9921_14500 [Fimbriimonadaceae bacterium]|nr:hypothetical protein [Chthonomonadaceae bacterium]MCO5298055.1 hypothetical protein [Fimbriimonadaceae bacterium]